MRHHTQKMICISTIFLAFVSFFKDTAVGAWGAQDLEVNSNPTSPSNSFNADRARSERFDIPDSQNVLKGMHTIGKTSFQKEHQERHDFSNKKNGPYYGSSIEFNNVLNRCS